MELDFRVLAPTSIYALGKQSREKICSYLDIVKIALTPPPPPPLWILDAYKELCQKKGNFLNSASNNLDSG